MSAKVSPLFTWRSALVEDERLIASTRHVALTLSLYMSERGDSAFPSVESLAKDCARGKSTIVAAIAQLEACGWLEVERAPGKAGGRGRTNAYRAVISRTVPQQTVSVNGPEAETVLSEPETVLSEPETVLRPVGNGPEAGRLPRQYHANTTPDPDGAILAPDPGSTDSRDLEFEALYAIWVGQPYPADGSEAKLTPSNRDYLGTAAAQLRKGGATAEAILAMPEAWTHVFPGRKRITWTPWAAVRHWPALAAWIERGYVARASQDTEREDLRRELTRIAAGEER